MKYLFPKPGSLLVTSPEGEVLADIPVPAGIVDTADYSAFIEPGDTVAAKGGVPAREKRWCGIIEAEGRYQSGANPDFTPRSQEAAAQELRLQAIFRNIEEKDRRLDAREAALASIERIPRAPAAVPEPEVIEPAPVPAPKVAK